METSFRSNAHEETYKGHNIRIVYDASPENPRNDDNVGIMVCSHKRYQLGDTGKDVPSIKFSDYSSWAEVEAVLVNEYDAIVILPLYLYDHSGITMSTSSFNDRWDSGQVGFIFTTKKRVDSVFNEPQTEEELAVMLKAEVETYDKYLTNEAYGFLIRKDDIPQESCYGYWTVADALANAKDIVNQLLTKEVANG